MDPDENLARQLRITSLLIVGGLSSKATKEYAEELAELVTALHEWLIRGGALPKSWQR